MKSIFIAVAAVTCAACSAPQPAFESSGESSGVTSSAILRPIPTPVPTLRPPFDPPTPLPATLTLGPTAHVQKAEGNIGAAGGSDSILLMGAGIDSAWDGIWNIQPASAGAITHDVFVSIYLPSEQSPFLVSCTVDNWMNLGDTTPMTLQLNQDVQTLPLFNLDSTKGTAHVEFFVPNPHTQNATGVAFTLTRPTLWRFESCTFTKAG